MLPKSDAVRIVEESIRTGKTTRDGAAEAAAALACRYYESHQARIDELTAHYKLIYKPSSTWNRSRPKISYGITRAFADELGQLYSRPIKREFGSAADAATWAEIGAGFNSFMSSVDRFTFLSGMVAARPLVMASEAVRWVYYTRDQIEYVPDALDPLAPHWLILSFRHGASVVKHWWSAQYYVRTVNDIVSYTAEEEKLYPEGAHNYGRIPLVLFRNDDTARGFFGEPASDLVAANRTIDFLATGMNWTMVFQGASTLVQTGGDPSKVVEIGPESKVGLPAGASLAYVSPDPKIDATIAAINLNLMLLCKSRRIPEDAFLLQRQGESGVAIVARQASLEDYRQARAELFRPKERELIQLAFLVVEGREIPPPSIQYEKPMRPMSEQLMAELIWLKGQHVVTAAEILMAREPGLEKAEAVARIAKNRAENMASGGMVEEPVFREKMASDKDGAE